MTIYANAHTAYGEPLLLPTFIDTDDIKPSFLEFLVTSKFIEDIDDLNEFLEEQNWVALLDDVMRKHFPLLVSLTRDYGHPDDTGYSNRVVIAIKRTVTSVDEDSVIEDYPAITGMRDKITVEEKKELSSFFSLVLDEESVEGDWLMWLDISL